MTPPRPSRDLPQQGDTLHMDRTREPLRVGERVGEGGQGVVHRVLMSTGTPLALKWYRPHTTSPAQRDAIARLAARQCPHPSFLFPIDTVVTPEIGGFGYVMPWMDKRFVSFAEVVNDPSPPGLQAKAKIGRRLAEAFNALHTSGLCYRDINFGNLWVDPIRGDIAIIDNDNVGTDDGLAVVWGALRFMAPEVVRRERKPSTITDLHSLAVLLFYLMMHGHPLDGARMEASLTWDPAHHRTEEQVARQHYGDKPLFVFDPADDSNRPISQLGPNSWWPLYPGFVQRLFIQAFTVGLQDASLDGRVRSGSWRDAFVKMHDLCMVCPNDTCKAALVFDPDAPQKPCWNCGRVPPRRPILEIKGSRSSVLLVPGATLSRHHITNDRDYDTLVGEVVAHPNAPGGLILRNNSDTPWHAEPVGEEAKTIKPGQGFAFRRATINFGRITGQVEIP